MSTKLDIPLTVLFSLCKTYLATHQNSDADYYAFGGCVRDFLRDEKPVDIDFYISDKDCCDSVLQSLIDTGRIDGNFKKTQRYSEQFATYHFSFITNKGELFPVDLVTRGTHSYLQNCDFTCNNLLMRIDGTIGTRVSLSNMKYLPTDWTLKCMRDAFEKNLVWMAQCPFLRSFDERIDFSSKMQGRLTKMLEKGYTNTGVSLTKFKLIIPRTHLWFKKMGLPESENFCSICRDNYDNDSRSILLKCGHDYHYKCIKQWKTGDKYCPGNKSCPICRAPVYYALENG